VRLPDLVITAPIVEHRHHPCRDLRIERIQAFDLLGKEPVAGTVGPVKPRRIRLLAADRTC